LPVGAEQSGTAQSSPGRRPWGTTNGADGTAPQAIGLLVAKHHSLKRLSICCRLV